MELDQVRFHYQGGADILHIPSLLIERHERVLLYGPSGSGKTTLLGLLAGVLQASAGNVQVLGQDLMRLSARQRDAFRGAHRGPRPLSTARYRSPLKVWRGYISIGRRRPAHAR